MLALLCLTATGAWAQEQSETIVTTNSNIVEGTHFTISNNSYVDGSGMCADMEGITVTPKNGETITQVVISCTYGPGGVNDGNTSVSSGTKEITNGGGTITVTGVNASTFTFTCSYADPQFGQFVVYYTEAPAPAGPEVTWNAATKQATFTMPAYDVELEVEYYPGMFTLGGDAIEGGTVEVVGLTGDALPAGFEKDAEGNIYVAKGTTFTVKATPEEGYHFVCWSDDENNTNPEREITMPADGTDLSLTATFAENEYDITFSEGTNPDPENPEWTATPNPAKTKQTVTVTYSGSKKVLGVKAEKKAAAPATVLSGALVDGATIKVNFKWRDSNFGDYVQGVYNAASGTFTVSKGGNDWGISNNNNRAVYKVEKSGDNIIIGAGFYDFSNEAMVWTFNTTNDTYTTTNGTRVNEFPTEYGLISVSVNDTDITSQLTAQ